MTETTNEDLEGFKDFLKIAGIELAEFSPVCYYEPRHRDALIFQVKDCSFREIEFDDFTLMLQNHVEGKHLVGIKIHNIKTRFNDLVDGEQFKSINEYIQYILQANGQYYSNTAVFIKQCQQLEIDIYNKIYNQP